MRRLIATKVQGKIGGFLGLELPFRDPPGASAWDHMLGGSSQVIVRVNARSALAALLEAARPERVWYPAYTCPDGVLTEPGPALEFYPVGAELIPDVEWLETRIRQGDAVVGVDYFGTSPPEGFRELVKARTEVLWIEDRAQALDPGEPWGDWLLYSPRKLFGVPDGGLAVCLGAEKAVAAVDPSRAFDLDQSLELLAPRYWRFEDENEVESYRWYERYRAVEAGVTVSDIPISRLSAAVLRATDVAANARQRVANISALEAALPDGLALLPGPPTCPLIGLPIVLENRDAVASRLAREGIFCPVHWRGQRSPRDRFEAEHRLSEKILTLPCDQRYGQEDMKRVAQRVLACL